jgi:glutamate 5-kinase
LLDGDLIGTLFWPPASDRRTGRRRWIATARPAGTLHVDEGAATALLTTTASLLPVGVQKVEGHFTRGDVLRVVANNHEIGRGLARYGTQEAHRTAGQIAHHLDPPPAYDEIIHRDDWVPAV